MRRPSVALLGLGTMGSRMAGRIMAAGFPLTVYNRTPDKAAVLVAAGARVATTPGEAVAGVDVAISMVSDDGASRQMWRGDTGGLSEASAGQVLVESSTLTVGWVKDLALAAAERGCEFIDAPVTGSKNQAASGELNFLVGGPAAALETIRPLLEVMSRSITHLGPTGSGALVKLINNFVCGTQVASLAEAVAMVERSSLDRDKTLDVLANGACGSPLVKLIAERMRAADFTPNFLLRLLAKDLGYAITEGRALTIELTTAENALALFQQAIAHGDGEKDMAAIIEQFRRG